MEIRGDIETNRQTDILLEVVGSTITLQSRPDLAYILHNLNFKLYNIHACYIFCKILQFYAKKSRNKRKKFQTENIIQKVVDILQSH